MTSPAEPRPRQGHELAILLSVAARIEPELMRAVRVTVAPLLDVSAETDLWFGDLVERRGFGYIVLRSDLLPQLRAELTERLKNSPTGAPLHRLWSVIERMHRNGSPALFAEERATWHAVSGVGTEAEADIEHALRPALRALVEEARDGVARWFSGAWQRLPEPVRRTTTAWQLATVARAQLADAVLQPQPPERLSVTDVGLIAALLPRAELRCRRVGPMLVLGEVADDLGSFVLQVPDTDPQVLDLLDQPVPRTLQVGRAETVAETVGWGPVRLLAADGAVYELPPPAVDLSRGGNAPRHGPAPGRHIVLSHAGFDQSWAAWISDRLQQAGHRVTSQLWNPDPSRPLTELLDDLLDTSDWALLLIGATYCWLGGRTTQEWDSALTACAESHSGRLATVIVDAGEPPATATALPMADLRGTGEQEARHRLFDLLGVSLSRLADEASGPAMRFPDTPPAVSNAPRRNPRFSGREAILDRIRQTLSAAPEPGNARAGQHHCVLLGPSGVGKSQLVTEYAHRFGNEYDIVWWISAAFQGTAREQLAELAPRLDLAAGQGIGNRIRAVKDALRVGLPFHRWLLVLDSADDMREIEDLLPEGSGHVLITSRNSAWAEDERVRRIDVPPFPRNESVAYIRATAPRLTAAEADQLAEAVQDFPLLLSHTAAWLDTNPMPVPQYIDLVRSHPPERPPNGQATQYPRALESSWTITLASLRERNPAVVEFLDLFTHFSPEALPLRLLQSADASVLPQRIAAVATDPAAWDATMRQLSETSTVRLEFGATGVERATMPRLYHTLLREQLSDERRERLSRTACVILAGADPQEPQDAALWPRYAELIPHLEISGSLDRGGIGARLVLNCIDYLRTRGEAHAGLRLCEQAKARWRRHRPFDDPDMLIVTYQHANMLRRTGRYQEAEAVARDVVDRLSAARPADHPDLQRARNTLGGSLVALGRYQEAYELYDRTAHTTSTTLGEEAVATQQARTNLSIVLTLLGRYQEALDLSAAVLAVRSRHLGPYHASTLYTTQRQAWTLRLLGRYAYALGRQEANVHDYRRLMGQYTVTAIVAEHNLAQCLRRVGDLTPARNLMRELVERAHQIQGPHHPEALFVAADYASLLREDRSLDQSWDLATTAARGYANLLGHTHPYSIGTAGNIGLILQDSGDRDEARRVAERALHGMTASMGATHPWTIGCALNAASARSHNGDAEGAADLSRLTLERSSNAVGRSHPLTLACQAALAQDLRALRRETEADQLQQEALARLTGTQGEHSPQTAAVRRGERPYWDFEPQPT